MKIDRKLNIIVPVETDPGKTIYVHSAPIGREVFERYFMPLSRTFSAIYGQGLGAIAGPRIALMMLKKVSMETGDWDGPDGVGSGLMNEIRRLTNMAIPDPSGKGWTCVPWQDKSREYLSDDDVAEVENSLVFFTVASVMHRRWDLPNVLGVMSNLWGAQTSSLNCTEFAASLQTLIGGENSGEKEIPSSIPS